MPKYSVQQLKIDDEIYEGEYTYREYDFRRDDSVQHGYYGRYAMGGFLKGYRCGSRKEILDHIDSLIEAKKESQISKANI